jgi:hypothetical protein
MYYYYIKLHSDLHTKPREILHFPDQILSLILDYILINSTLSEKNILLNNFNGSEFEKNTFLFI